MIIVPDNTIAVIPNATGYTELYEDIIEPLHGKFKRDWFVKHAYYCLPLVIGNQYGFLIKSLYDFNILWNGGTDAGNLTIEFLTAKDTVDRLFSTQSVISHFGMGTVTIQLGFSIRTPPGINTYVGSPPNIFVDGIGYLTAVVETDNLRRDFTFNIKATRKNRIIKIKKGDPLGFFMPYPRHFIDKFTLQNAYDLFDSDLVAQEQQCARDFGTERSTTDRLKPNQNGRRYFNGEDIYGNKFADHQKRLNPA